ncbi:8-amino-7-oxononanoate synthase [Shewanella sp. NIFS-20-20]|uniref:aminotransferase class I/II-fold pyridoxal phosphate-dependent enzyme n=1 Tax=Shewanella sp. NIFS-20-20 TaxID=2853806 RepID=UPI001C483F1B|nr:8-amino-7-oxononanoate synthase [Shewanella sp. NIFS-20-20]MBV7317208.1 8-amino-7-oxononanoate synthase [Shewanella sp. NIFS-20-20]
MTAIKQWQQRLSAAMTAKTAAGLLRQRRLANPRLDFSHNDYLGLARDADVAAALAEGALTFGHGSTASPLISGYTAAHQQLEQGLCRASGQEAALLFCSGFSANGSLFKTLFGSAEVILADKLMHASALDGIRDSGAKLVRFSHNDVASARAQLQRLAAADTPVSAIVTESVFSMDGDEAPLVALKQLALEFGCALIVDDAHGFGWRPLAVQPDLQLVTFGKALGGQGAAILASQLVIDYLVSHSRAYIYSTALSPASCVAVNVALDKAQQGATRAQLMDNIAYFREVAVALGIEIMPSHTPIQGVLTRDIERTLSIAYQLREQGIAVGAIRPPTVPQGLCRLRITLSVAHQPRDIQQLLTALAQALGC